MVGRQTHQLEDREVCLQEHCEATPTSPMTACVSECIPDTHVQHNWIKTNCAVTSPETSLTYCQPLFGSREEWISRKRSPRSSRRKWQLPRKRFSDSLVWMVKLKPQPHKQWKNRSATRKSPPRCKIASMRSPPKG